MIDPTTQNIDVIDRLVHAYNDHDPRAFANLFTLDATHGTLRNETPQHGREAIYEHYVGAFLRLPELRTEVLHRVAVGNFIVDHERVQRSHDSEPFDVVAIYEIKDHLITQLDFVRE
jgi:uncharacterized protein (TIGR02246 family)